jgi:hypothetical protein
MRGLVTHNPHSMIHVRGNGDVENDRDVGPGAT